jgi:hypothetical protein
MILISWAASSVAGSCSEKGRMSIHMKYTNHLWRECIILLW